MSWPERWRARWIWFEIEALSDEQIWAGAQRWPPDDAFAYARRAFHVEEAPKTARCRVSADGRYVFFVNGVRLGAGPARAEPAFVTYDEYDLAPHLVTGSNVIALLARHYGGPTTHWKPAHPVGELGYGGVILEAEIDGDLVMTDASWRMREAPYGRTPRRTEGPPPPEILDGREIPSGWNERGYDDASWPHAIELRPRGLGVGTPSPPEGPYPLLTPRSIAMPEEREVQPVARRMLPDGTTVFDFGRIVSGKIVLTADAHEGTAIDMTCGEDADADGAAVTQPRDWKMRYIAAGRGREKIEAFEPVGLRYVSVSAPVGDVRVSVRERVYPRPWGAWFRCSDPTLDEIWEAGARTLDLCSDDAFIDCPGRERRAWLGDAAVVSLISLVANPDTRLVRHTLRLHAQGVRPDGLLPMAAAGDFSTRPETIPDFSLRWISALARVHRYTGDDALIADLLPVALRALAAFERFRGENGLLDGVPGWVFVDWAQLERGRNQAALDALFARALDDGATCAEIVGDHGTAQRLRARASDTRNAFERYWDEGRGVYVDAADPVAGPGRRMSQQTNTLAMVSGCAPRDRLDGILDVIVDESRLVRTATPGDPGTFAERMGRQWMRPERFDDERDVVLAQPWMCHELHEVLAETRPDALLPSIRRWQAMLARGNGCFEEHWDAEPGLSSRAHAWSATPTFDLVTYVAGIRPVVPGCDAVEIAPMLADLEWVDASMPTRHGFIRVRADAGRIEAELPPGVTATIAGVDARGGGTHVVERDHARSV